MRRAVIGIAVAALAGCGGLSREEYDKRGTPILARAVRAVEADKQVIREHPRDPAAYRALASDLRRFADELDAVGTPPTDLRVRHDRIVEKLREGADLFDEAAGALVRGDLKTFARTAARAIKRVDQAAR